jgi:predicted nuclease of restriction endonuclease-like (RecB) superfamily
VPALTDPPEGYADWLASLRARIYAVRQRAALAVNTELLRLCWQIGRDILDRQAGHGWGGKVVERLSYDLRAVFPDLGGFSRVNLMYMRAFAEAWPKEAIVQHAVGQIPWGHNIVLLTKLKDNGLRLRYAAATIEHGWFCHVLTMQIETRAVERQARRSRTSTARCRPSSSSSFLLNCIRLNSELSGAKSTSRSMSLSGPSSPLATDPKIRTRFA